MPKILVLSGHIATGKTTLANNLSSSKGARIVRTRELLLAHLGTTARRSDLQLQGEILDQETNGRWVAEALTSDLRGDAHTNFVVVDSCRIRAQIVAIRDEFESVFHVHLTASVDVRSKRFLGRSEDVTFEAASEHFVESEADSLATIADIVVDTGLTSEQETASKVLAMAGLT